MSVQIISNIQNATVLDSYDTGTPDNASPKWGQAIEQYSPNPWKGEAGDFNDLESPGHNHYFNFIYTSAENNYGVGNYGIGTYGVMFRIVPNSGFSVAAEAYVWNEENPDAITSDLLLSKQIIDKIEFVDKTEPWAEDNEVLIIVRWKDNFVVPVNYPVYQVKVDIKDNPGAQPFGVRFVNLSIVNDFADAVWCTKGGQPSGSGLNDMSDNYLYQQGWTDAFKTKRPLKFRGEAVGDFYSHVTGGLDIESIKFTPAEDAIGETVKYFDTRDLHLDNSSEHTPSEDAYGVSSSNLQGAEGFQLLTRKDVIYAGLHVRNGEPQKVGTIRLRLSQDIYIPKNKEGTTFMNSINVEQFRAGYIANLGRVSGWAGKWTFAQLTPERIMTWQGLGTGNSVIGRGRVDQPYGNIAIGRVDPSSTDPYDIDDFQYSAGENENLGNNAVFYETDQAHRPMVPHFSPPVPNKLKTYMTQNDEISPNPYGTYNDTFGSGSGVFMANVGGTGFGAFQVSNNYLLSQAQYDSGEQFLLGQDINEYISEVFTLNWAYILGRSFLRFLTEVTDFIRLALTQLTEMKL
jgi:hypothetical protein